MELPSNQTNKMPKLNSRSGDRTLQSEYCQSEVCIYGERKPEVGQWGSSINPELRSGSSIVDSLIIEIIIPELQATVRRTKAIVIHLPASNPTPSPSLEFRFASFVPSSSLLGVYPFTTQPPLGRWRIESDNLGEEIVDYRSRISGFVAPVAR